MSDGRASENRVRITACSWASVPNTTVSSQGQPMSASEAGALAVELYGEALERLACDD
jgi:hypothetical protein